MASNKNITMRQYNGVDYDTLYPKTIVSQVVGAVGSSGLVYQDSSKTLTQDGENVTNKVASLMSDYEYKVGDIKVTARTDLGDEWVLCNGGTPQEGYIELSKLMVPIALSSSPNSSQFALGSGAIKFVEPDGTPYVLAASATNVAMLYTLSGEAATSILATGYSSYNPKGAAYGAGYYVIPGSDTYSKQFIGYKAGLAGTDTLKEFSNGSVGDIIYQNGYFVMAGETSSSYPCIWYATTPGGTWTQVVISSEHTTYGNYANVIRYLNGYFVAVWSSSNGVVLAYSTNGISWSDSVAISGNYAGNTSSDYVDVVYGAGRYCIMQTSMSNSAITVFTSLNLDSGWVVSKVFTTYSYRGVITNFADNVVLICQSPDGYYGTVNLLNADGSWTETYKSNNVGSGYAFAKGAYTDSTRMCVGGNNYLTNWYIKLPNITFDKAYAYIKAK